MADHLRKQIRDAAAVALTGLTTTGANVFASRVYRLQDAQLPALRIYTRDEEIQLQGKGVNRSRERSLDLVVEAVVKVNDTFDDVMDQIQKEVEIALDANQDLGGRTKFVEPIRVEDTFEGELEKTVGLKRMTFEVLYYTAQGAPDTAL